MNLSEIKAPPSPVGQADAPEDVAPETPPAQPSSQPMAPTAIPRLGDIDCDALHSSMSTLTEIEFVGAIRTYSTLGPTEKCAFLSGGNAFSAVDAILTQYWKRRYEVDIDFRDAVIVEEDDVAMRYIQQTQQAPFLCNGAASLAKTTAVNISQDGKGAEQIVPFFKRFCGHLRSTGRVLTLEQRNSLHTVGLEHTGTLKAVRTLLNIVDKHKPEELALEIPEQLCRSRGAGCEDTEAEWVCKTLRCTGFVFCTTAEIDSGRDSSGCGVWIVGLRTISKPCDAVSAFSMK